MEKKINYYSRDFVSIRSELIDFARKYYPDTYTDFDDASIGSMLIELNAAVADMLSYNIDRVAQENVLEYAQQRRSLYSFARNMGVKLPNKRSSITLVSISVDVPVRGSSFDLSYAPLILQGAQIVGGGQNFELKYNVDFSSPYSQSGLPNRTIIPNLDGAGRIVSYTLTKQEIAIAGRTKYFKRVILRDDVRPFLEIDLPDTDIITVDSIIALDGINYNRLPTISEQLDVRNIWYIVNSLVDNKIFLPSTLTTRATNGIVTGEWQSVAQRAMYEFSDNGFCTVRFGNGIIDTSLSAQYNQSSQALLNQINTFANNFTLGAIPRVNTTMFIKYRVGGGVTSNLGAGVLNTFGEATIVISGQNPTINQRVRGTLKVTNPIPAFGGGDILSTEEIRNIIKYNFASQKRAITLKDYYSLIYQMDGRFGVPHKCSVIKRDNKIEISVIGVDENGKLTNVSTETLKQNIAEYLSEFKAINDYVTVRDGRIVNLGFEFDILSDRRVNQNEITAQIVDATTSFVNGNTSMGVSLFLSQLIERVNSIPGVINLIAIRVFNKVGGLYSLNESYQSYISNTNKQIDLGLTQTVMADYNDILEIKYPDQDIRVRYKLN